MQKIPHLLFLLLGLVLAKPIIAQWDNTNVYGNLNWLGDKVVVDEPIMWDRYQIYSDMRTTSNDSLLQLQAIADSNAYSNINYQFGSIRNQHFLAELDRPLGYDKELTFRIERGSHPGWMTSSFARSTDLQLAFTYNPKGRFSAKVGGLGSFYDNELNGGLSGTDYSISQNNSSAFSDITSDVNTSSAFRKNAEWRVFGIINYDFVKHESVELGIQSHTEYKRETTLFRDEDLSKGFYPSVALNNANRITDSTLVHSGYEKVSFYLNQDLDSSRTVQIEVGTSFEMINIENYSRTRTVNGLNARAQVNYKGQKLHSKLIAIKGVEGINDQMLMGQWSSVLKLHESGDSVSEKRISGIADVHYSNRRNPLLFDYYFTSHFNVSNDLKYVQRIEAKIAGLIEVNSLAIKATGGYHVIDNFTYLDQLFKVNQLRSAVDLFFGQLDLNGAFGSFRTQLSGRYQKSNGFGIYDFPELVTNGSFDFELPLFKKKLILHPGLDGWYFSKYNARGYSTLLNTRVYQNTQQYGDYIQLNAFVGFKINTAEVKIHWRNWSYGLFTDDPIVGPNYPSIPSHFLVEIGWKFKN